MTIDIDEDIVREVIPGLGWSGWLALQAEDSARFLIDPEKDPDLFARTNEFIASTGNEARDGDVIDQGSWRLGRYRRNPVILDNHNTDRLVGKAARVGVVEGALRIAVDWDLEDPHGATVARQHRQGFRRAMSVRWITGKRTERNKLPTDHPMYRPPVTRQGLYGAYKTAGGYLERCELLEASSVTVPGDASALQTRSGHTAAEHLHQVPDQGLAEDLGARLSAAREDPSLLESDPFLQGLRSLVLGFVRSDAEFRTALRALAIPAAPTPAPDPWRGFFTSPSE